MQMGGDKGMVLFCRREVWAGKVVVLGSVANCETMIQAIQDVLDESFVRMFGEQGAESTHSNWGEGWEMGWGERSGRRARALRTVVRLGGPPQTVWSVWWRAQSNWSRGDFLDSANRRARGRTDRLCSGESCSCGKLRGRRE